MDAAQEMMDESFSRLLFLVQGRKRIGLLSGLPGSGKTRLLAKFRGEMLREGHRVVFTDFSAGGGERILSLSEFLLSGLSDPGEDSRFEPFGEQDNRVSRWEKLARLLLREHDSKKIPVLLLDNFEQSDQSSQRELLQLVRFHEVHQIPRLFVLAVDSRYVFSIPVRILDRVDLKLELS